ncbi:hypothetical protein OEG84_11665 [Hoeflea sp. G2-23]|uniref:Uncharacterized protein n=1 Tax=Hoeflea algicola TaxID=2983763 RepID=A0ABT3Z987_9HYPH|nr:hypothetical protein [Hoeflea algicola]MCY0148350.1 hypothetical protein [Hoeflea algicola]
MFDTKKFLIDEFGGIPKVESLLHAYGAKPASASAIAKWFQRGSVAGERLAELLCILEMERGAPIRLTKYWEKN